MVRAMKVGQDVLEVLDRAEARGTALRLVGTLDRDLYVRVAKVIEAAGGKWNRTAKAHLFEGMAADAIENVLLTGEIARPQDFGQFDSPPEVVARLMELAEVEPGMSALEPSAGVGNIVVELLRAGALVTAVEQDPKRYARLLERCSGQTLRGDDYLAGECADFLDFKPPDYRIGFRRRPSFYDRVVMNPPFAKQDDIRHVMRAASFLAPGGRLVSVMSAGVTFRENALTREFREFVDQRGGSIEALPEGAFKASGTMVRSVIVTFEGGRE